MHSGDEPNLTDEFDLLYIRSIGGWSDLHVITPGTKISVQITHIFSDPMDELSALCCALLRGEPQSMARLYDEPGTTLVTTSIYTAQKHVARIEFWECQGWDHIPPRGTLTLSMDVKIRQFVGVIYRQFEKVRWLYAEKSYQKNRNPFPHASFEAFEQLLKNSMR